MYKSILRYFIAVMLLSLGISCALNMFLISNAMLNNTEREMGYSVKLITHSIRYNEDLNKQIEELAPFAYSDNTRISIIDKEGKVIADTYKKFIAANHLHRKEVQEALKSKDNFGYAIRDSETTNENMLYVAYYHDDYIVRLSMPYNGITEYLSTLLPAFILSALFSFFFSYILSRRLAHQVTEPLNEIIYAIDNMSDDFRFQLEDKYEYEEFDKIASTLDNLTHRLRKSMRETQFERNKQDEIIRQMREGFVLLDEKNNVLTINEAGQAILGDMKVKDNFIKKIHSPKLIEALNKKDKHQRLELANDHSYYRCYLSNLPFGKAIFFVDITMIHNASKMREDFFSSVSHELKTPITSIRGYVELLSAGVINDEAQQQEIMAKILKQVKNMNNLINDILMLSRLDSRDIVVEEVPLHIKKIIENVLADHEASLLKRNITVHTHMEDVIFKGNDQQLQTLVSNLISNAIKYNKDDGELSITLTEENDQVILIVKDTGIGIPLSDQARVFERFYRVDKGRSRALGGTGLGLAIVKHIVSYYKGKIDLQSKLDVGTTITISLPQT